MPRAAHRAALEGGLTLLVKQDFGPDPAATGLHRQPPPQRRAPREPQRTLQMLTSGLGALIVLGVCGLSGFFVVADERRGRGAEAGAAVRGPGGSQRISTRAVDARPLTLDEVFPQGEVRLVSGTAAYAVGMTHIDTDCPIAATGELRGVLDDHACSQVVRASMTAPYGGYRVTAGIFNLADEVGAAQVGEEVGQLVENGGGTFAAMASGGPGTDPSAQPFSQAGWRGRGHYLVYCVISRPDGRVVRDDDRYARRIVVDLVESYLGEQIIGKRTLGP